MLFRSRIGAIPGVGATGAIQHLPFSGIGWVDGFEIEGRPIPSGEARPTAGFKMVAGDYFRAVGQRLVAGRTFTTADLVVMSPGVPLLPEMIAARQAGVEVIAEIELAYRFMDPHAHIIAITGTNGKSTTTALTGALCAASDRPTFCGGNLGNMPLIDVVDHPANVPGGLVVARSEERRVGKECTVLCRSRWSPYH